MIRHPRLAIAGSIGLLVSCAVTGVLIGATAETCAGAVHLFAGGMLMLSVIGAICREASDRPRLLGFAVFGWGYLALAHWYSGHEGPLPTVRFVPGSVNLRSDLPALPPNVRIAHDAWAVGIAFLGGWLTGRLFGRCVSRAGRR